MASSSFGERNIKLKKWEQVNYYEYCSISKVEKIKVKSGHGSYHPQWNNFVGALENLIDKEIEIDIIA